jgi:hypothetical protein
MSTWYRLDLQNTRIWSTDYARPKNSPITGLQHQIAKIPWFLKFFLARWPQVNFGLGLRDVARWLIALYLSYDLSHYPGSSRVHWASTSNRIAEKHLTLEFGENTTAQEIIFSITNTNGFAKF